MSRRLKVGLMAVACVTVLGGAFLWALPEIVRRTALDQIPKRTGRAVAIGDVDLNLFNGHLAIKNFRLGDREGPEAFVEFERLDVRISLAALLRSHLRVAEIALAGPAVRIARTGGVDFNFSDLLATTTEPTPAPDASPWTLTVERLDVSGGRVSVDDRAVSPHAAWRVRDLSVEAARITTRSGAPPGRLTVRAKINEAVVGISANPLRFDPLQMNAVLSIDGFEMRRLNPYVYIPLGTPYLPRGGRLGLVLTALVDSSIEEVTHATLSGTVNLEGEALAQVGRDDPFVSVARLGVDIKEADALARSLTVASLAIEGLDLKARRDARGVIDLIEMFKPPAKPPSRERPSAEPPPPSPGAREPRERRRVFPIIQALARGFQKIRIERITLGPSTARFIDDAVKPQATLALTKLQARLDELTWPVAGPASLTFSTGMPGGGTLDAKGRVIVLPFDAEWTMALRDGPIEPYHPYIPIPGRVSGRFSGDSKNRVAFHDGTLVAISTGDNWADNVEIREPGAERPTIQIHRMELHGIHFDWPKRAGFARASIQRPRAEIERAADGGINVRRLFTPLDAQETPPAPEPVASPSAAQDKPRSDGAKPKSLFETMQIEFREVRLDDGHIRFLDRTTTPAFSQDLSRLQIKVSGLGNQPGRRADLAVRSVVGGDADLDVKGEIGALGAPPYIELVGELRRFKLASVDPYASSAIGWVVKKGELEYKVRFKLDGDQLAAQNDVVVGQLQVAPSRGADEVKRRLGLPLGLITALIKDQKGDIRASVPVTGSVTDPKFSLSDTIWTAVKNVLVNIVSAPFKAIGRLFSGGGEKLETPTVDSVVFAAGSSALAPAMEEHLLRVADFMRRSPFVGLKMTPVLSRADAEALRSEAVSARLRDFQKERGLGDAAAALAAYWKERFPDAPLPKTGEEQLASLREREAAPDALLADLGRRRLQTTRARLHEVEGIPETRLTVEAARDSGAQADTGEGRIDFSVEAGG